VEVGDDQPSFKILSIVAPGSRRSHHQAETHGLLPVNERPIANSLTDGGNTTLSKFLSSGADYGQFGSYPVMAAKSRIIGKFGVVVSDNPVFREYAI
jgi:hypothetical protein